MDRSPRLLSGAARGGDTVCAAYTTERGSASGIGCEGATLCAGLGSSAPFSLLVELSVACRTFRPCRTSTAALAASVVELPPNGACKERHEGIWGDDAHMRGGWCPSGGDKPRSPSPTYTGSYEAAQSTISVEPTLLSLNGAHHTKCEQPRRGCIGHYSPLRSWRPNSQPMDQGSLAV